MAEPVSRAAGKLEAALERFGLASAVRGARAVDVGASTGGFTQTLLAHGAAHVTAVDVGHGQLVPALRADARVTSMEGVDWKRLSLNEAPGPFDFFSVDVSFVAARNMLRGLAFRLRPGAQGVVLVKPQFELADRQVRGGRVDDENLRRAALEKVRAKAESLGFQLVAHADSPVAGGSGTIEILAQLRFVGRPDSLPAEGESRGHAEKEKKPARARATGTIDWFAVVAPGLEEVAGREVAALAEAKDVRVVEGGVEWRGPVASGVRANLWLRVTTRVLARVGVVKAREFGKLRHLLARLPWATFVAPGSTVAVRATTTRCRLYHTGAIAETVVLGVADVVKGARLCEKGAEPEAGATVYVRGVGDEFTLSVDASGELLHRRGARTEVGAAPLRETLAAGVLALAGWTPDTPLYDPMCGAGTFPIEAAVQAAGLAPGRGRAFAIERWPLLAKTPEGASAISSETRAAEASAPIAGSDRDAELVESARRNAERAGVASRVTFSAAALEDARPPAQPGLVVVNPPYGRRLGDPRRVERSYRDLGRALRARFPKWRAAVLAPSRVPPATLGLPVTATFPLVNGGLRVNLIVCQIG
jgi:putative N6-adenine-specific DNA methylase